MHQVAFAQKARKENGAKIIVIDVHKNQTARFADWFIPILPGTDSALALGLMHILFAENMVDYDFYNPIQWDMKSYANMLNSTIHNGIRNHRCTC